MKLLIIGTLFLVLTGLFVAAYRLNSTYQDVKAQYEKLIRMTVIKICATGGTATVTGIDDPRTIFPNSEKSFIRTYYPFRVNEGTVQPDECGYVNLLYTDRGTSTPIFLGRMIL